jgi:hypothetical protein
MPQRPFYQTSIAFLSKLALTDGARWFSAIPAAIGQE